MWEKLVRQKCTNNFNSLASNEDSSWNKSFDYDRIDKKNFNFGNVKLVPNSKIWEFRQILEWNQNDVGNSWNSEAFWTTPYPVF